MEETQGWEQLVEAMAQLGWTPVHEVEDGTVYRASKLLEQTFDDYDWYTSDWFAEDPPSGIERHALLSMLWDSSGAPISWDGYLGMVQVGHEAAYVYYILEEVNETPDLLGKVVPPQTPAAYRTLFLELMRSAETLRMLPDHIDNSRPDLLDRETIRQGFWEMMEQVDGEEGLGWAELRQRIDGPYRGLAYTSERNAPQPVEEASHPLSEAERQALLDRYFDKCYEEASVEEAGE